jgi:hypothetical protein
VLASGTQNSDLILGNFSEAHLSRFDSARLHRIEALLDCSDPGPFDRIIGGFAPSKEYDHDVMHLRGFAAWCASLHWWRAVNCSHRRTFSSPRR